MMSGCAYTEQDVRDEYDNLSSAIAHLHVFLSNNTEGRENLDSLCHHVGLFGVNRSCQQQQAPFISQDSLQSILCDTEGRRRMERRPIGYK